MQSLSLPLSGELTCSPSQLDLLFRSGQEQGKPGTTAFTPGNSYQTPKLHHSKYPGHREVWQRTSVCLRVMLLTRFVVQSGCSAHKSALPHCVKLGCKTSGSHINPGTQDVCLPSASPCSVPAPRSPSLGVNGEPHSLQRMGGRSRCRIAPVQPVGCNWL